MVIKGFFPTGFHTSPAPFVQAYLLLPKLNIEGLINFLIDSGADITTLSILDAERLSIDYRRLQHNLVNVDGVGGEQSFYQEDALLMVRDESSETYMFQIKIDITRRIKAKIKQQRRLPSVLGRDIMNQCNLIVNYQQAIIELTPPQGAKMQVPTRRLL
jgi:predicted aspartyl protease